MKSYMVLFVCPECGCVFLQEGMHHVRTYTEFLSFNEADTGEIESDDLAFRAELANANGADVFISIHTNSVGNPGAHGTEVYHYPGSVPGKLLAACLQERLVAGLGTVNRGVKAANFQVLRETDCPAALVEVAFISNEAERSLLTSYAGQLAAALAMVYGLADYAAR